MDYVLEVYNDKICLARADDIVVLRGTPGTFFSRWLMISNRSLGRGILAAAHKVGFRPKLNQVVWEKPPRTDGEPLFRAHPGTE